MKRLFTAILLLILSTNAYSYSDFTYTMAIGTTFKRFEYGYNNPANDMLSGGIRYYINQNFYIAGNLTAWDNGVPTSKGSGYASLNGGYRTSGKVFFETSLGYGYLANPDGKIKYNTGKRIELGYMTGHKQFELNIGGGYKMYRNFTVLFGWTHFSNCYTICNLNDSYDPNPGRDFARVGFEQRF